MNSIAKGNRGFSANKDKKLIDINYEKSKRFVPGPGNYDLSAGGANLGKGKFYMRSKL